MLTPSARSKAGTKILAVETVTVERKTFAAELCENHLGRFIRITEKVGGRTDQIVIPCSGFKEVRAMLARLSAIDTPPPA